mmetsp:Transcript_21551/g.50219  ORF Transcript_21551/g.50219 Transcript_21551/m.50219 type:complete len:343 (+) Transcript_21551:75-1103(+)
MDDEELEYTLLNKREVLVYQIPPASSSAGHKADDWKKCIWRGRCRIAGKGQDVMIKMIDASSGQLFAQCSIPNGEHEKYVERVTDSSRYFVLKITNGQRHAFIGLGFEDRNDAFDFNCTLRDFKSTWVDRDKQVDELPVPQVPSKDLSLKEGQKITINLKGMEGRPRRQQNPEPTGAGFAGILAPPPPSSSQSRRRQSEGEGQQPTANQPATQPQPVVPQGVQREDLFGDFADFQSAAETMPAPQPTSATTAVGQAPLALHLEQLNLGSAQPTPSRSPAPSSATSADPFSGLGTLGESSNTAPGAMAQPQSMMQFTSLQEAPLPKSAGRVGGDPFDEFDIFK